MRCRQCATSNAREGFGGLAANFRPARYPVRTIPDSTRRGCGMWDVGTTRPNAEEGEGEFGLRATTQSLPARRFPRISSSVREPIQQAETCTGVCSIIGGAAFERSAGDPLPAPRPGAAGARARARGGSLEARGVDVVVESLAPLSLVSRQWSQSPLRPTPRLPGPRPRRPRRPGAPPP